jgi:DNA-binding NtrC family response regulator
MMPRARARVLVVDDDTALGTVLCALLTQAGLGAQAVTSGDAALTLLQAQHFDLVLTDLEMPGVGGMELLEELRERFPGLPVVMLTAFGTVALAVEAMKRGAADFLEKPFEREQLVFVVTKALSTSRKEADAPPVGPASRELVAESAAMKEVLELVRRAATSAATVLIRGETGTGKDLVARELHAQSPRRAGPFVKVQCSGLPDALLESELFGYERGAFTGATARKPGRVELAQHGTLFLDEVGDIAPAMQVKLLRVLQDREYERLGGTQPLHADVRFLAATHRDLEAMVARGEFREDLYYRLNVIPIWLAPMRARPADVAPLARHFCRQFGEANGKPGMVLERGALSALAAHDWPGNVRQLQNFLERLVVLSEGPMLRAEDVERELGRAGSLGRGPATSEREVVPEIERASLETQRRLAEREAVREALERCRHNRTQAARILGVSRRTLYNKLQELELD